MSNGRAWTPLDDARLARLAKSGMGDVEIGRIMGRHAKFIGQKRRAAKVARGISRLHVAMMARFNLRAMVRRARV